MQTQQPTQTPQGIIATVKHCNDPDIAAGTKVYVTGYTATVPKVYRQQAIGAPKLYENVNLAFAWDDLEFDNKGAAVVLQAVSDRIHDILDKETIPKRGGGQGVTLTLVERVEAAMRELKATRTHLSGIDDEEEQTATPARPNRNAYGYVDDLPEDTLLLPEVWETLLGLNIMDWDGWNDVPYPDRGVGRYLGNPCTREEFERRAVICTQNLNLAVKLAQHSETSITELCAQHRNLERYIATLEGEAGRRKTTNPAQTWNEDREQQLGHLTSQINRLEKHLGLQALPTAAVIDHVIAILSFKAGASAAAVRPVSPVLTQKRAKLPDTRPSVTHKFDVGGQKGYITVGCYDKACEQPGEVFITVQKEGSTLQGFASAWARSVSMLLQYGVPVADVAKMFAWHKFDPRGHTPDPRVPYAHSVVDYVARWLGNMFVEGYAPEEPKPLALEAGQ